MNGSTSAVVANSARPSSKWNGSTSRQTRPHQRCESGCTWSSRRRGAIRETVASWGHAFGSAIGYAHEDVLGTLERQSPLWGDAARSRVPADSQPPPSMDTSSHTLRDVIALFRQNEPPPTSSTRDAERDALWDAYRRTVLSAMRWSDGHGLLCCLVRLLFGERWNTPM